MGHLGASLGPKPLQEQQKHCKIQVKVHLEVTTPARDAPEVDFDMYFTMFVAPPEALPDECVKGGGISVSLGLRGREYKGGGTRLRGRRSKRKEV